MTSTQVPWVAKMSAREEALPRPPLEKVLELCRGPPCKSTLMLLSGGAEGVDAVFDDAMARFAPFGQCIHWSFSEHRAFVARLEGRVNVPDDVAQSVCDPHLRAAATQLYQRTPSRKNWHVLSLFRRNVLQALWADAMFAVTWEDVQARYALRIGGGTQWAAQVYVNRFRPLGPEPAESCNLWLYEVNTAVWKKWDCSAQAWNLVKQSPVLSANMKFAGIGTKTPPSHAIQAIHSLFGGAGHVEANEPAVRTEAYPNDHCQTASVAFQKAAQSLQAVRRWRPKAKGKQQRECARFNLVADLPAQEESGAS